MHLNENPGVLFTDFYQLTMAQLYFKMGLHQKKVQFDYFFRSYPDYGSHQAGYCISAGLQWFVSWLMQARFDKKSISDLRSQKSGGGEALFSDDFLNWLSGKNLIDHIDLWAVPEGRVVHPNEPVIIVQGDFPFAQIIESSLLNHLNYQTLIATKASRIKNAGANRPLIEFGLRRAQHTGAEAGTRAALIGGADFSSNTGISFQLGFEPKGTHAHSMVQAYMALGEGELGAFRAYAQTYPDDCLLLVDTINTLESGIPNAIKVFEELKKRGHKPSGIRLDSGDLAYLAVQASLMMDAAGFPDTIIVLSNNIDEMILMQVLRQIRDEAFRYGIDPEKIVKRLVYGVGTRLITSQGNSYLDGVYKLSAVYDHERWKPALKISDTPEKTITPGYKQVWRIYDRNKMASADLVSLQDEIPENEDSLTLRHPIKPDVSRIIKKEEISRIESLLIPIISNGNLVYDFPSINLLKKTKNKDMDLLDSGVKRIINPHRYHVSLSDNLFEMKEKLIREQKIMRFKQGL